MNYGFMYNYYRLEQPTRIFSLFLYKVLSHNDLSSVCLNHKNIQYLDISYNSNMSERVTFNPAKIDTIVREGVADGKRLLAPNAPPLPHPTFISE